MNNDFIIVNDMMALSVSGALFRLALEGGCTAEIEGPSFEIDGVSVAPDFASIFKVEECELTETIREVRYKALYRDYEALSLLIVVRVSSLSSVVRVRYELCALAGSRLTKAAGCDKLTYLSFDGDDARVTEVRLSEWNRLMHFYMPSEHLVDGDEFAASLSAMGPIFTAEKGGATLLVAYEHGSTYPDCYLNYCFSPDGRIALAAKKANYLPNQLLSEKPFESIWFDIALVPGGIDEAAAAFREFLLKGVALCDAGRRQRLCYNTWGWQERNRWSREAGSFTELLDEEHLLEEIDAAHECGIEVFVIDAGIFRDPGDWTLRQEILPNGLTRIRERLESYGMELGVWVGGVSASETSEAFKRDPSVKVESVGECWRANGWADEPCFITCLASGFWMEMADSLIRLRREEGISYFKVDGVGQYLCEAAGHDHGGEDMARTERLDSYAFELVRSLARMAERIHEACPDVVLDFDVTEPGRCFGLGLLPSWRFFLINNGSYFKDFDRPLPPNTWDNVFVCPGAARASLIRNAVAFDRWVPLSLLLTHGLLDMPLSSIDTNMATVMLGFSGLWGNVAAVPPEGRARLGELAERYRRVREDAMEERVEVSGTPAESYEVYERISKKTGRGCICAFSSCVREFPAREDVPIANMPLRYITKAVPTSKIWTSQDGVNISRLIDGRILIEAEFGDSDAIVVFFE